MNNMDCKDASSARSDCMHRGLSLTELSKRFASPLTEEQAWAVCYQCCAMLQQIKWPWPRDMCMCRSISMDRLMVTADGKIELLRKQGGPVINKEYKDFKEVLLDVGIVVYSLLDVGLAQNEERELSPPLESLIEWLTEECCLDSDSSPGLVEAESVCSSPLSVSTRDSGIIEDSSVLCELWNQDLHHVLKACEWHALETSDPATHYTTVCRNMVEEATTIINLNQEEENFTTLPLDNKGQLQCWVSVLEDIKRGTVLKSIPPDCSLQPAKVELSKHDKFLMEINKFDRTSLNKVKFTKELEYHTRKSPPQNLNLFTLNESKSPRSLPRRATLGNIHCDLMLELKTRPALKPASHRPLRPISPVTRPVSPMESLMEEIQMPRTLRKVERCSPRRYSSEGHFRVCRSQSDDESLFPIPKLAPFPSPAGGFIHLSPSLPKQKPLSSGSSVITDHQMDTSQCITVSHDENMLMEETVSLSSSESTSDVFNSGHYSEPCEDSYTKVELTFSEVVKIREIETKAELLNLQQEEEKLFKEIRKHMRCFTCHKTKFTIFTRPKLCHICKRYICSQCSVKYDIVPPSKKQMLESTSSSSCTLCSVCWEFVQSNSTPRIFET